MPLLHNQCQTSGCLEAVVKEDTTVTYQGAAVTVNLTCAADHLNHWNASEFYEKLSPRGRARSKLNVRLATYLLLTGHHFNSMKVRVEYFIRNLRM